MFKCEPEIFAELVEQEDIIPTPYLGHYKWVALERLDVLPWSDTSDLITKSYEMVAAKATMARTGTTRTSTTSTRTTSNRTTSTRATRRRPKSRRAGK